MQYRPYGKERILILNAKIMFRKKLTQKAGMHEGNTGVQFFSLLIGFSLP
jgi:hypothetical protein